MDLYTLDPALPVSHLSERHVQVLKSCRQPDVGDSKSSLSHTKDSQRIGVVEGYKTGRTTRTLGDWSSSHLPPR